MYWKHPPVIKIYEALGSVADKRMEISGDSAKVYSSSGNKFYDVVYDPPAGAIMVNDNGSFYKGYLGYPAIAFLMASGAIQYSPKIANEFKGIAWKDINTKFKNDFDKTLKFILSEKSPEQVIEIEREVAEIDSQIKKLHLKLLGPKTTPPEGY